MGVFVKPAKFSCEIVSNIVDDHLMNMKKLSIWHWRELLESCGTALKELQPPLSMVIVQQKHCNLYIPCSPSKASMTSEVYSKFLNPQSLSSRSLLT